MAELLNPVLVSVVVLCALALLNVHIILSLLIAAVVAGLLGGLGPVETFTVLVDGLGGQGETALSYILLGTLAVMVNRSGLPERLVRRALPWIRGRRGTVVLAIAGLACLSQNLVPVHIAFIPILIPPLLEAFNRMRLDRRAVAAALTFGLQAPYMLIPLGFGLIFHGVIAEEMGKNGLTIEAGQIPLAMAIPVASMVLGLLVAVLVTYRRRRSYAELPIAGATAQEREQAAARWTWSHTVVVIALAVALAVQLVADSLVMAALVGVLIMFLLRAETWRAGEEIVPAGVSMMATIAFVMLIAAGYANVLNHTGAVDSLVTWMAGWVGGSQLLGAAVMMLVGLVVTMGIGTSFGTIPVIAAIFVPLAATLGFSPLATIALIGTAGALGDAGSPASDSTLGPTSGLNADGQHSHVWDTCVPTFLHYNIPLFAGGIVAGLVL